VGRISGRMPATTLAGEIVAASADHELIPNTRNTINNKKPTW
jgi:hypothetical protein